VRWSPDVRSSGTGTPSSWPWVRLPRHGGTSRAPASGSDLEQLDSRARPKGSLPPEDAGLPFERSQAGVLVHVFHELAQHRGQMEITRDVLRAERFGTAP
jgi:hypothetical protein